MNYFTEWGFIAQLKDLQCNIYIQCNIFLNTEGEAALEVVSSDSFSVLQIHQQWVLSGTSAEDNMDQAPRGRNCSAGLWIPRIHSPRRTMSRSRENTDKHTDNKQYVSKLWQHLKGIRGKQTVANIMWKKNKEHVFLQRISINMIKTAHRLTKFWGDRRLPLAVMLGASLKCEDPKISMCFSPTELNRLVSLNKKLKYWILCQSEPCAPLQQELCKRRRNPPNIENLTERVNQSCH